MASISFGKNTIWNRFMRISGLGSLNQKQVFQSFSDKHYFMLMLPKREEKKS
jgi:hypothetical protein